VLRYSRSSQETGIAKGEYARVTRVDAPNNRLTVERKDGTEQSYDPRRQQGVSVYREQERASPWETGTAHRALARLEAGQPRAGDRGGHRPGWADEFSMRSPFS